ncbi:MAG TPA: antitoxin [Kineosporiaceae bacterium]|nr:antitoxin [Kineosporiaceae bacterium]
MGTFDELKNKGEQAAAKHPEQVEKFTDQANEKAGDSADKATGGKHADQVDTAQKKADDAIGS